MTQGRPTYADLARALRDMVARNIVRRLPAGDA